MAAQNKEEFTCCSSRWRRRFSRCWWWTVNWPARQFCTASSFDISQVDQVKNLWSWRSWPSLQRRTRWLSLQGLQQRFAAGDVILDELVKLVPAFQTAHCCFECWRVECNWWQRRTAKQHFTLLKVALHYKLMSCHGQRRSATLANDYLLRQKL